MVGWLSFPGDIIQEDVKTRNGRKEAGRIWMKAAFCVFVCFSTTLNVRPSKTNQAAATTCVILGRGGAGDGGGGVCVYNKAPQLRLFPQTQLRRAEDFYGIPNQKTRRVYFKTNSSRLVCNIFIFCLGN